MDQIIEDIEDAFIEYTDNGYEIIISKGKITFDDIGLDQIEVLYGEKFHYSSVNVIDPNGYAVCISGKRNHKFILNNVDKIRLPKNYNLISIESIKGYVDYNKHNYYFAIMDNEISEKLKFTKQAKKKDAKTDTFKVFNGKSNIGQVKWSSRMRGYAYLPTPESNLEITEFIKDLNTKRRAAKKKSKVINESDNSEFDYTNIIEDSFVEFTELNSNNTYKIDIQKRQIVKNDDFKQTKNYEIIKGFAFYFSDSKYSTNVYCVTISGRRDSLLMTNIDKIRLPNDLNLLCVYARYEWDPNDPINKFNNLNNVIYYFCIEDKKNKLNESVESNKLDIEDSFIGFTDNGYDLKIKRSYIERTNNWASNLLYGYPYKETNFSSLYKDSGYIITIVGTQNDKFVFNQIENLRLPKGFKLLGVYFQYIQEGSWGVKGDHLYQFAVIGGTDITI